MSKILNKIIREPLIHFLIIGLAIFALYFYFNPAGANKETIVIDDDVMNRIGNLFERQWGRQPSESEWNSLINQEILEEVYYRQALKMKLDHNDEIIRRRMHQKLDFITSDMARMREPSDSTLLSYYLTHKEKYTSQPRYSFSHIYFNPDKRQAAKMDAAKLLGKLPSSDDNLDALTKLGDPFPFSYHADGSLEREISNQMGDSFAFVLASLPVHKWSGPVLSGFGSHLVYVDSIYIPQKPSYESSKADVLRDYRYEYEQHFNENVFNNFRKQYTVEFKISDKKKYQGLSKTIFKINAE